MNSCPVCGEIETRALIIDLLICAQCSHIFKNMKVPPKAYHTYRSSAHQELTERHVTEASRAANMRLNFIKSFKDYRSGPRVLEIGCGHKFFLDAATKQGFEVEGTELSKALIKELKYKVHYGNPSEIKELGVYDIIAGFHVLEHLNDPLKELLTLSKHLAHDGIMVLEFPNLFFETRELFPTNFYEGLHTQYFNNMSFNIFIKRCGLKQVLQTSFYDSKISTTMVCLIKEDADTDKFKELVWKRLNEENGLEQIKEDSPMIIAKVTK